MCKRNQRKGGHGSEAARLFHILAALSAAAALTCTAVSAEVKVTSNGSTHVITLVGDTYGESESESGSEEFPIYVTDEYTTEEVTTEEVTYDYEGDEDYYEEGDYDSVEIIYEDDDSPNVEILGEESTYGDRERSTSGSSSVKRTQDTAGSKSGNTGDTDGTMCRSYLTGKQVPVSIGRSRPVALMIENDKDAVQWQSGTSNADIIYEARVEGGITRLEALFEDYEDVEMIMPIRSCRPQFVYYSREFNAFYGHYGQVIYAVQLLQMPETYDIAGLPYGESGQQYRLNDGSSAYSRHHSGVTGVYTNYKKLHDLFDGFGWDTAYPDDYEGHYQFAEDGEEVYLEDGEEALVVLPGFVSNHARFQYNEDDGLYYRYEFGEPQTDHLNDEQLAFKNILIQIGPSHMLDDHYLFTDPVNEGKSGKGWYITNGRAEPITWQKENWSKSDPVLETVTSINYQFQVRDCDFNVTRYYDKNGDEIKLNQGKTFVEIIRDDDASKLVISDDPEISSYVIDEL